MRYRNPDPMEQRQAKELITELIILIHETIENRAKKAGYKPDSVLARELRQDVLQALSKILRIQSLKIPFGDTGVRAELKFYDTRNIQEG